MIYFLLSNPTKSRTEIDWKSTEKVGAGAGAGIIFCTICTICIIYVLFFALFGSFAHYFCTSQEDNKGAGNAAKI